jgi:hypothetical protein
MRISRIAPLAAVLLLAACGGGTDDQTAAAGGGDEAGSAGEAGDVSTVAVASRAQGLVQPRPGEYRTTLELLDFQMPDIPGMTEQMKQQMRATMGASLTQSHDFCLTPEEAAANGPRQMAEKLAKSNCTMKRFDISGNTIVADMSCPGANGAGASTMRMEGQMNAEGSVMTMAMDQEVAGRGSIHTKMKVTSERTGDCP